MPAAAPIAGLGAGTHVPAGESSTGVAQHWAPTSKHVSPRVIGNHRQVQPERVPGPTASPKYGRLHTRESLLDPFPTTAQERS